MIDSTKAGIRFQSKKLNEYSQDYLETKRNYDDAQKAIVGEIINTAGD